jgi:Cu-processing system permease protein
MTPRDQTSAFWLCAGQELRLAVRSRWTQAFAVLFAVMTVAVAASGYLLTGGSGLQDLGRTAASLLQIVLLLVPLTALLLGVMSITPDAGSAELLFSQPVARRTVLAGKLCGAFLALAATQSVGFGAAGLLLFARSGPDGALGFLGVVLGSLVLTVVFLGLGAAVGAGHTSRHRTRDLATTLVLWILAVVLFDLAALGIASFLPSGAASRVLMTTALVNPIDAVRTGTLMAVDGTSAFGAASLALLRFTGGTAGAVAAIGMSLAFWMVAPLAVAAVKLDRADF